VTTETSPPVMQMFMFRAKPDVGDDQILDAADVMLRDVVSYPGFTSSRFLKGDDGQWVEILEWCSLAEAEAVLDIATKPSGQAFDALIEIESVRVLHLDPRRGYGRAAPVDGTQRVG
jgi:hypothetical protein